MWSLWVAVNAACSHGLVRRCWADPWPTTFSTVQSCPDSEQSICDSLVFHSQTMYVKDHPWIEWQLTALFSAANYPYQNQKLVPAHIFRLFPPPVAKSWEEMVGIICVNSKQSCSLLFFSALMFLGPNLGLSSCGLQSGP